MNYRLSHEAAAMQRSVLRDLLKVTTQPDIISLAGGLPDSRLLPYEAYRECLNTVLTRDQGRAIQYGPPYAPLQAWIADFMRARGVECTPEQIFLTNGNQQGAAILTRLFLDSGQPAVTEAITFTGIQQAVRARGAVILTVPTDLETGVDSDALEEVFQQKPRLCILIPDFHNPLGVSISDDKRRIIAELATRYEVPVVEDDPYSTLRFTGEVIPPIKAYDSSGYVFYMGSFSKMLAPGLRMGWLIIPEALLARVTVLRESIDLETSALTQRAAFEFLDRGLLPAHLKQLNAANRERCEALLSALREHLDGIATWTEPEGGLFVWVTLPEAINTWELLPRTVDQQKVAFVPGGAFAVNGGYNNTMRLNFSNVEPDAIREGVRRLSAVIKETAGAKDFTLSPN